MSNFYDIKDGAFVRKDREVIAALFDAIFNYSIVRIKNKADVATIFLNGVSYSASFPKKSVFLKQSRVLHLMIWRIAFLKV